MEKITIKESLLVKKALNIYVDRYNEDTLNGDTNAELNFKLNFIAFVTDNESDCVEYGIEYLNKEYPDMYDIAKPIILEYQLYGTEGLRNLEREAAFEVSQSMTTPISNIEPEPEDTEITFSEIFLLLFTKILDKLKNRGERK